MSHFVVLVIGDNVEKQLAPYHEFECTGVDDEYVQTIDITDEVREGFTAERQQEYGSFAEFAREWHGIKILPPGEQPDLSGPHKYGYTLQREDGSVQVFQRTNPNAKWDWYQIGGRWTGWLKGKPGVQGGVGDPGILTDPAAEGCFDRLLKCDLDLEGMRAEAAAKAGGEWDKVRQVLGELSLPPKWDEFRQQFPDIDNARIAYHELPSVKALAEAKLMPWFGCPVERYGFTREEFCQRAADSAIVPYALLKDGQWHEKGTMGWWGMSSNEMDSAEWARKVNELLDSLPDDTLLTVVDCHI